MAFGETIEERHPSSPAVWLSTKLGGVKNARIHREFELFFLVCWIVRTGNDKIFLRCWKSPNRLANLPRWASLQLVCHVMKCHFLCKVTHLSLLLHVWHHAKTNRLSPLNEYCVDVFWIIMFYSYFSWSYCSARWAQCDTQGVCSSQVEWNCRRVLAGNRRLGGENVSILTLF